MASATRRWVVVAALVITGCSGNGAASSTEVSSTTTIAEPAPGTVPRVDEIKQAVVALETQLGAPQQFFEINATSSLVNLIVSLNDGKVAQPWVYFEGQLSSTEGGTATGFSFAGSALDFDPDKVLGQLQAKLPESTPDLFFIEGGQGGTVRYSVAVSSKQGGQFIVVVGPDGSIQSVDPS